MGIEQKFMNPTSVIAAVALAAGMTFTPCDCREPPRTRYEESVQMELRPDIVRPDYPEANTRVIYEGPTISSRQADKDDFAPTMTVTRKDGRFYF